MLRKASSVLILICYSLTFPVLVATHSHHHGSFVRGPLISTGSFHAGDESDQHAMCEVCYRIDTSTSEQVNFGIRTVVDAPAQIAATIDNHPPAAPAVCPSESRGPPAFQVL